MRQTPARRVPAGTGWPGVLKWLVLAAPLLCCACVGWRPGGAPGLFVLDSVSNACVKWPGTCAAMAEEEGVSLRFLLKAVNTLQGVAAAKRALDARMKANVETALVECAEQARTEVLLRRLGGKSPTLEQCREQVSVGPRGEPITRAMQFGDEMHQLALQCAQERLGKLRPGGFSLEPRYRYDPSTRTKTLVSPEEEQRLLREGLFGALRGTLVPDVVLHEGDPLRVQAVYDFKFPCVVRPDPPEWRVYPRGHPYQGRGQDQMYKEALNGDPTARIVPRLGVVP